MPVLVKDANGTNQSMATATLGSDQSPINTLSYNAASGSLAALNAAVTLDVTGIGGFAIDVRGTFAGTITFEGSIDNGTTWTAINVLPIAAAVNGVPVTTTTAPGAWFGGCAGTVQVRARMSIYTSGTATVIVRSETNPQFLNVALIGTPNMVVSSGTITTVSTVSNLAAIAAGTNAIGDVGVQYRGTATGAASRSHFISAATTNPTVAKAGAGRLLGWCLSNTTASWRYVKLHNQATAPTAGAGVVQTIGIPPNQTVTFEADGGIAFTTGIAYTCVTGSADADATAVAAGDVVGDLFFA